jgi:hypothetical protein
MKQLTIPFEPTNTDICMMCHASSECLECCKKCKKKCNGGQICMIGMPLELDRYEAWINLLNDGNFKELRNKLIKKNKS